MVLLISLGKSSYLIIMYKIVTFLCDMWSETVSQVAGVWCYHVRNSHNLLRWPWWLLGNLLELWYWQPVFNIRHGRGKYVTNRFNVVWKKNTQRNLLTAQELESHNVQLLLMRKYLVWFNRLVISNYDDIPFSPNIFMIQNSGVIVESFCRMSTLCPSVHSSFIIIQVLTELDLIWLSHREKLGLY